jgi:hypothetical protein
MQDAASSSDIDLMRRTAAGDRDAFATLYQTHHATVYRFARLMTGLDHPCRGHRLTNIVRAEPPPDVFTVPSDYRIVDLQKQVDAVKRQLEERKIRADQEIKKFDKARTGGQE